MTAATTPIRLDLKKDEKLQIEWQDGLRSTYSISMLRSLCPCATCKTIREGTDPHDIAPKPKRTASLTVLPGNYSKPLSVISARLVGNYALQIDWSDEHASGIYSFEYLRSISPQKV